MCVCVYACMSQLSLRIELDRKAVSPICTPTACQAGLTQCFNFNSYYFFIIHVHLSAHLFREQLTIKTGSSREKLPTLIPTHIH
jgi:hypothetical protein